MKYVILALLCSTIMTLAYPSITGGHANFSTAAKKIGCAFGSKKTNDDDTCGACVGFIPLTASMIGAADGGCSTTADLASSTFCYAHTGTGACAQCVTGYYDNAGTCTTCGAGIDHCMKNANATPTLHPLKCSEGYTWANGTTAATCNKCAANVTDMVCSNCDTADTTTTWNTIFPLKSKYIAATTNIITDCPTGCTTCTSATSCSTCAVDYYLPSGTGEKLCAAKGASLIASILSLIALSIFARF